MTDDSHMGSDLPPIDPASLNWARYWYPIARKGLLVAGLITVISAIGSMGFLVLHWRTSSIRELISDRRISVLEVQAKKVEADLERAKSDRADADARATGADAEAKRATERASALGPTQLKHRNASPHWRKKPPPLSCRRPVLTRERPRHNQHHRNSKSRGY
jgi:hypothetical protein